jgi:FKBP-type peptidyl-prolyl cis-trans isomerase (trigger factor)
MEDFLRQVSTAFDENFYYEQQDLFEAELANTYSDYQKRQLKAQWDNWASQFKGARPLLQEELGKGAERAIQRNLALQDLEDMFSDPTVKLDPAIRQPIEGMLRTYNDYINARDSVYGSSTSAQNYKDLLKQRAKAELERLSKTNRNAQDAYFALFSRLIRD